MYTTFTDDSLTREAIMAGVSRVECKSGAPEMLMAALQDLLRAAA
jgi:DNA-binding NarL/FixJ family response regulator